MQIVVISVNTLYDGSIETRDSDVIDEPFLKKKKKPEKIKGKSNILGIRKLFSRTLSIANVYIVGRSLFRNPVT